MKVRPVHHVATQTQPDVASLDGVLLDGAFAARLDGARSGNTGSPAWQARKLRDAHDLLALAQLAPGRCAVLDVDLSGDFTAAFALNVPIPKGLNRNQELIVAHGVLLGLRYTADALRLPQPGMAFFQVLDPRIEMHPSVSIERQLLCLGAELPAGIRVRSLVVLAFLALSMQSVQVNELDPAGVMNLAAARWWQANLQRTPLTREPFLPPSTAAPQEASHA